MRTFASLTLSILLMAGASSYGQVDMISAETIAKNFFHRQINQIEAVDYNEIKVEEVFLLKDGYRIYAVNMTPEGWMLLSGSKSSVPVVAYSFVGKIDKGRDIPVNVLPWITEYDRQIKHIESNEVDPGTHIKNIWNELESYDPDQKIVLRDNFVEPLLRSTWDQGKYYNEMCPEDPGGPSGHCPTGCVATAMGQVMQYFRWPDTGIGSYTYQCPPYGTQSADFGNSEYGWDAMAPSLHQPAPEVAELLYHLGVSVDMVYGPNGSGMYNHKAAYSLRTYFKYLPATEYVFRDSTAMDWDSLLVSHLDRKIPLYYAGWSVPNINGHAFVCDGYQDTNFYHFNWGWGGAYDGYFYTDALNPGGSNFNLAQEVIINAIPDTNLYAYPSYCQDTVVYSDLFGTLEDGSGPLYHYEDNSHCYWLIQPADSTDEIILEFHRFKVDEGDTLFIYDGSDSSSPLLAALSGDTLAEISTGGREVFVEFITNNTGNQEGWLASYSCNLPEYCQTMVSLTGPADTISDGSGPYQYHNQTACMWMIQPEDAAIVTLYFTEFDTEEVYDFVEIYDLATNELLASYSGSYTTTMPDPVISPSGKMFVAFNTNYTQRGEGWTAHYMQDVVNIDETVRETEAEIKPNPVSNMLTITGDLSTARQVIIFNTLGRVVLNKPLKRVQDEITLNVRGLNPGVYLIRISGDKNIFTEKFVKQ